jgi:F-type H+-transporting ATPase subunit a
MLYRFLNLSYFSRVSLVFLFFVILQYPPVSAQEHAQLNPDTLVKHEGETKNHGAEKFNPGKMIVEHVVDNHEWHIATIGHTHVVVPLPILIIYKGEFHAFMSGKFRDHATHESVPYKGFMIPEDGPNKGKIVSVEPVAPGAEAAKVYDFSITKTVFAIFLSGFILLFIFISVANKYKKSPNQAPSGLQNLLEPLILFIRDDVAKSSIGEKRYERYMPYLLTIFFFILLNNLLGIVPLFPGGANVTGNIAVTGVMAVCTLIITSFTGTRYYWAHIVNTPGVPWWLKLPIPLMPVVELIGVITKPFVLMVRLFANITAGHIIILGFVSIIIIFGQMSTALGIGIGIPTVAFMVFMDLLELLVAFIQAYVFTLLSALYFGLAFVEAEHH